MAELLTALGVMSGTSMDGVDIALLTTDGEETAERGPFFSQPYPAAIRARIADALNEAREIKERTERPASLATLEGELTAIHGEAIRNYLSRMGIEPSSIDVIGYHGHTVLHRPEQRLTVQLGDGAMLARLTGRAVVNDLRAADVQAGGEARRSPRCIRGSWLRGLPNGRWRSSISAASPMSPGSAATGRCSPSTVGRAMR